MNSILGILFYNGDTRTAPAAGCAILYIFSGIPDYRMKGLIYLHGFSTRGGARIHDM
jgi:hypothetical protein